MLAMIGSRQDGDGHEIDYDGEGDVGDGAGGLDDPERTEPVEMVVWCDESDCIPENGGGREVDD